MSRHEREQVGAEFELTVEGELGPVLRFALRPLVAESRASTTFRAAACACSDVADLVGMLNAEGFTIDSIRVSGTTSRRAGRSDTCD